MMSMSAVARNAKDFADIRIVRWDLMATETRHAAREMRRIPELSNFKGSAPKTYELLAT